MIFYFYNISVLNLSSLPSAATRSDYYQQSNVVIAKDEIPPFNPNSRKGCNHPPPSENCVFSALEHPLEPRPVCKLKFVRCGPVEKKPRALYVSRIKRGGPTRFETTLFRIAKLIFLTIFNKIFNFSQIHRGRV